jgi:hypothetical protein
MPSLLTLVRPTERGSNPIQIVPPFLQSTNFDTMSKSESDLKKAVAVAEDDEPDEW